MYISFNICITIYLEILLNMSITSDGCIPTNIGIAVYLEILFQVGVTAYRCITVNIGIAVYLKILFQVGVTAYRSVAVNVGSTSDAGITSSGNRIKFRVFIHLYGDGRIACSVLTHNGLEVISGVFGICFCTFTYYIDSASQFGRSRICCTICRIGAKLQTVIDERLAVLIYAIAGSEI